MVVDVITAVAWLGAPLGRWEMVKTLVREECDGADWPPSLRWIHNTFTGIDGIVAAQPPAEIIVTNMRGESSPHKQSLVILLDFCFFFF